MKVGVISAYMDYHRKGRHHRGVLQPQIGPLIAALLPPEANVEVVNDTWEDPDWNKEYDLLFISSMHADFDRARQISHYWRRRGATTVFGGILASTYPGLCAPFFDAVVTGDPETTVPDIYRDFRRRELKPVYVSKPYDPSLIPVPRFDLLARKQHLPISFEATRGCPFSCEFCALTGWGTRHHTRTPADVVRDIRSAQEMLRGLVPGPKLRLVQFTDNNIGGNTAWLHKLCDALEPLDIRWGSSITFNCVADAGIVKALSRSGCRGMFVGLESFNRESIADMHKVQNAIEKTKQVMQQCLENGILVVSGLMLNPMTDDCEYMRTIPDCLEECGLHVPTFISFESPIPGTPHFHRLASESQPALLPNALLRDFNGYTLVTRPKREPVDRFVETYKWLQRTVYSTRSRFRKLAHDLPLLGRGRYWIPMAADLVENVVNHCKPHPGRTYLAGTDIAPPEAAAVPLTDSDFATQEQRDAVMEPFRVTDAQGRVLPEWLHSVTVFEKRGVLSAAARSLVMPRAASAAAD